MANQGSTEIPALKKTIPERGKSFGSEVRKIRSRCRLLLCWAHLLRLDARVGLRALVDVVVSNECFVAMQVSSELEALGKILLALRPNAAVEIGTYLGGTLFFLTRLAGQDAKIVSVDLFGEQFGGGHNKWRTWLYRRFARAKQRLYTLQGDSHSSEMLERVREALGSRPVDYLFIDGDHTYAGVRRDFELYAALVRKGGVIAFHDIAEHPPETGCEVSRFWNEIKPQYRHEEILANPSQGWAGIGVLYVD